MPRRSKIPRLLEDITNIREDLSDTEDDFDPAENSGDQSETKDVCVSSDSNSEEENMLNVRRRRRILRLSSSSDESDCQQTEIANDGTVWTKIKAGSNPGRRSINTIFKGVIGPTGYAKRNIVKGTVSSAFLLIINRQIIDHIRICTKAEAYRVLGEKWDLSQEKFYAFLAILYARGAYETKNIKLSYLWSEKWGPSFFRNTMSRKEFTDILRFIRFDKKNERSVRLQTDKFVLISHVWNSFIENSQNCYVPGPNITIDEQLFPTKARCRFTQYMPNKPNKFGIKFWLASDLQTKYIINGFPYLGKDETRQSSIPLSEFVVLKLIEQYAGAGRNVTTDNFFTSKSLALKLLEKRTTLVGTIRGNKRELPELAKQKKDNLPRFSSQIYKTDNCTLTIYKSKATKKVLLLSTKHTSVSIEKSKKQLPETIAFYNKTKCGVDMTDQMARKYSVKSGSRRWPLQVFFNILDLAAINAWVLYKETTGENISRKDFLFQLAEELSTECKDPSELQNLNDLFTTPEICNIRKTCQIGFCNENKTINICAGCKKHVCGKCTLKKLIICKKCDDTNNK
ncbi:piggyBac transposable element-derived protein 4-like [Condylostylus longicornis]|uniref:piggyBac transposable element-derived protein 4-like n=1 Tax=Condylostylus longicornis TaxID=2530218 RepID=UPI00244E5972|nr:piggyBac transposable element-derived protein 4-like [Condylostylus longicornis]